MDTEGTLTEPGVLAAAHPSPAPESPVLAAPGCPTPPTLPQLRSSQVRPSFDRCGPWNEGLEDPSVWWWNRDGNSIPDLVLLPPTTPHPATSAPLHKAQILRSAEDSRQAGLTPGWGPGTCLFSSLKGSRLFGIFSFMISPSLLISLELS